jgi:DNA-binding LacI/PurR family transcriptional regulator
MSTMLKEKKIITIKEIAELAGVAKSTVSEVINNNPKSRVSATTFAKVKHIIDKYNYVPQVSARALSTRKTFQIGYLVSTQVTLGLSNAYFATIQSGVNEACKKRGYQTVVSTYDLTDIKNFVIPDKLRQRSVDALVLAGVVSEQALEEIKALRIPFIVIGGEYSKDILCLKSDMQSTYHKIVEYLIELGHRHFCYGASLEVSSRTFKRAMPYFYNKKKLELNFTYESFNGDNEFINGAELAKSWLNTPVDKRFTAFLSNDQVCCGFLSELITNGIKCPEEISIVSCSDTHSCEWNSIPITAATSLLVEHGNMATNLLIDLLEGKKKTNAVREILKAEYRPHDLIIRKTTGKAPKH